MIQIIPDTPPALFLICSHDHPKAGIFRDHLIVCQIFHGKQGSYQRSLVIRSSSSIKFSILFHRIKRFCIPAFSGTDYICMTEDSYHPASFSGCDLSCISVIIFYLKSHLLPHIQDILQRSPDILSKRSSFRRCSLKNPGDSHQFT